MNTPARFEALLWMASPMAAWAQSAGVPAPLPPQATPKPKAPGAKSRRKGVKPAA